VTVESEKATVEYLRSNSNGSEIGHAYTILPAVSRR